MERPLSLRLAAAGIDPAATGGDPHSAFLALVEAEDVPPTLDDRLALQAVWLGTTRNELPAAERLRAIEDFFGMRWEGFEIVGEHRSDPVIVVDYHPEWPKRFERWKQRLEASLANPALRIEHVGSTAVAGLAAKPVIDIQVAVDDIDDEDRYVPQIEALGVALRSRDAEHRYFRPPPGRPRDVQIHVCEAGSDWERDHLRFRDILRSDAATRDGYADLKRRLARRFPDDRLAYTEGKSDFVADVLRRDR